MSIKRVWLNLNTGEFSNSWEKGGEFDMVDDDDVMLKRAKESNWKLLEYSCLNDPDFEVYDRMQIRDKGIVFIPEKLPNKTAMEKATK